jgi:putative flippase GtrA
VIVRHDIGRRFARYNMVGFMGVVLKFAVLFLMMECTSTGYLISTALAVEAALLHNFYWHIQWTWRDRCADQPLEVAIRRLLQFQFGTGAVAMAANLVVMRLLVEQCGLHYGVANVAATLCAGLANFLLANFVIFAAGRPATCRT